MLGDETGLGIDFASHFQNRTSRQVAQGNAKAILGHGRDARGC